MVCRHAPDDPDCSSSKNYRPYTPPAPVTPDASNYEVLEVHRSGPHLMLKVRYPNCRSCAFEGTKIMIFRNVTETEALRWRTIDPHFRDPRQTRNPKEAPSPCARFPGTPEGWKHGLAFLEFLKGDQSG